MHLRASKASAHPSRRDWSPHGGEGLGHLARRPPPLLGCPHPAGDECQRRPLSTHGSLPSQGLAGTPSKHPGARSSPPASASAHLARLVELLLQPRYRHAASRRRASRADSANRRDRASDRLPGAAKPRAPQRAPTAPPPPPSSQLRARPGAASAPRAPARPGYYMATTHFRCRPPPRARAPPPHGPVYARAPPAGQGAHAHSACGWRGRLAQ